MLSIVGGGWSSMSFSRVSSSPLGALTEGLEAWAPLSGREDRSYSARLLASQPRWDHTEYQLRVIAPDGRCWYVSSRYSEMRELHEGLRMWYGGMLPAFPGKRLLAHLDPNFMARRMVELQAYLDGVLRLDGQARQPSLRHFLACEAALALLAASASASTGATAAGAAGAACRGICVSGCACGQCSRARGRTTERWSGTSRPNGAPVAIGTRSVEPAASRGAFGVDPCARSEEPPACRSVVGAGDLLEKPPASRPRRWSRRGTREQDANEAAATPFLDAPAKGRWRYFVPEDAEQMPTSTSAKEVATPPSAPATFASASPQVAAQALATLPKLDLSAIVGPPLAPRQARGDMSSVGRSAFAPSDDTESQPQRVRFSHPSALPRRGETIVPELVVGGLLPCPPGSDSWDWPLSRCEAKVRIVLVERKMASLPKKCSDAPSDALPRGESSDALPAGNSSDTLPSVDSSDSSPAKGNYGSM